MSFLVMYFMNYVFIFTFFFLQCKKIYTLILKLKDHFFKKFKNMEQDIFAY